jgi:hypothetical protein
VTRGGGDTHLPVCSGPAWPPETDYDCRETSTQLNGDTVPEAGSRDPGAPAARVPDLVEDPL